MSTRDTLSKLRRALSLREELAEMNEQTSQFVFKANLAQRNRARLAEVLQAVVADTRAPGAVTQFGKGADWHAQGLALMQELVACPLDANLLSAEEKERGTRSAGGPQTPASLLRLLAATADAIEARRMLRVQAYRQQMAA